MLTIYIMMEICLMGIECTLLTRNMEIADNTCCVKVACAHLVP